MSDNGSALLWRDRRSNFLSEIEFGLQRQDDYNKKTARLALNISSPDTSLLRKTT